MATSSLASVRTSAFSARKFRGVARLLMCAVAPVAFLASTPLHAATLTWDPLQNALGSDGNGTWDTTTPTNNVWATGTSDVLWPNAGTIAAFGTGGTAGTVTIDDATVSAGGLAFNATASGSNYTLAATGTNTLTLTGAGATITVLAGESPTISAPIAGTVGLTLNEGTNTGTLTLTGANTYTGTTTINSGTLIVGPGGTLGAAANALVVGQSSTTNATVSPTTTPGNLILNNSVTVGSLTTAINNTTANASTIAINGSSVLTVNGALTVGLTTAATTAPNVALAISGNELDLNSNLTVGLVDTGVRYLSTLDMSNLTTFTMNAPTGSFNGGNNQDANATILLAHNNTITAATMTLSSSTSNAGSVVLTLGNGTNTLNISNIILGAGKGNAAVKFAANGTGSVTINGTGGPTTVANITLSNFTSATPNSSQSNLTLATHQATVNAGTVIIAQLAGATGRTANGTITFDTGTFNAQSLEIGLDTSGGGTAGTFGAIGSFVLGSNATSSGVLTVGSTFWLGSVANTNANATTSTATFTINGGTANIGGNIILNKGTGTLTGTANSTLTLHAGKLNMSGFAIGTAAAPINTVNLVPNAADSATLSNLGGTGINGAGLTVNGLGTLTLAGNNSYSGGTTINTGSALQVTGSLPTAGAVVNNGTLTFAGPGATSLSGSVSGSGNTSVIGGSLFINGSLTSGPVSVTGGTLGGNGTVGSSVALSTGGTLLGGGSSIDVAGVLGLSSLTVAGGTLAFNVGATGASSITATTATFTSTPSFAFNIVGAPASGSVFTLLTAGTLSDGGVLGSLTPTSVGRLTFTPSESGNTIIVTVSGAAANLVFNGAADGTTFDNQTTANFLNGGTQDQFFTNDNVTFNDNNNGNYNVTLVGSLAPGSLTVNNSAGNYTFGGAGSLTGATGLTKSGTGSLTLANTGGNTYSGVTAIQNGKLILGGSSALPATANVTFGDAGGDSGTLDLGGNNVTVSSLAVIGGSANIIGSSGATPSTLTFQTGTSTFSGTIQDVIGAGTSKVALTVASGNLTLSGANTYTGGTTVNSGATLSLSTGGALASTGVLADNGTVNLANPTTTIAGLTGAGTLNLNGTTLSITSGGTFAGTIADGTAPGGLALSGGTFTLSGTNTFTGDTSIQNGTLRATSPTVVGPITGGNVTISNGGSFDVGAGAASNTLNFGTKVFKISGTGVGGLGALVNSSTVSQFNSYEFITLTDDATVGGERFDIGRTGSGDELDLGNHTLTIQMVGGGTNQPIFGIETNSGAANATLVTSGQIIVASGGIDLENKTLIADDGTSKITFNNGTVVQFFQTTGPNITRPMIFLGNNLIGGGSATLSTADSNMTLEGNVTLEPLTSGNANLTLNAPLTLAGTIAESGTSASVTKVANNTVTLSGAGNTWTGGTFLQAGTLQAGINNALPATTALTLGNGTTSGTLDLNGFNVSVGALATAGTGTANIIGSSSTTAPSTLTFAGTSTPSTFNGTIQDVIGSGSQTTSLVVSSGSLTLPGANTFTGGTTVNGGTLLVTNTAGSALGTGNVTLNGGTLGGSGFITGSVSGGSGAHTINPGATGANSVGTLTLGGLTTNANTTLAFDLAAPGGTNDLLAVTSGLTLNGGKLSITSQATTGAASLGYYEVLSYGSLTGSTSGIVLPAVANNILYTLDTVENPGFIDIHRGFIGDANDDGKVDLNDLNIILNNLGTTSSSWGHGNFDGGATIDLTDLNDVLNNLGTSIASGSAVLAPAATPEPASLGVLALGAAALIARRRKA